MTSSARFIRNICRLTSVAQKPGCQRLLTQSGKFNTSQFVQAARHCSTKEYPGGPKILSDKEWEKRLTPEQYAVCREKRTEPPFTGKYVNLFDKGRYDCISCGAPLFSSEAKYDSATGWPSFYEAIGTVDGDESNCNILRRPDNSYGMMRTEVICKQCDSHLGHVFDDGPPPTGIRFCINSMPLLFKPEET